MRKYLIIILVLICGFAKAQTPPRTGFAPWTAKWKFVNPVWLDSGAYITKIVKTSGQNRYLVYDSLTGKIGYRFVSTDLSGYVPFTGANANVNIGTYTYIGHSLKSDASDGVLIQAANGTDVGIFGAGNTANSSLYGGLTVGSLTSGSGTDSVVVASSAGLLKKRPASAFGSTYTAGNGIIVGGSVIYRDSLKTTGQYGNSWQNGMYLGSSNNRSVKFYSNSLLRGQLDSNGRWAFGTMKPIAPIHIGVAGSGRQKFMFVAEPGFLSTYGFNFYTDANTGGFYIHGFNNSVEASSPAFTIERNGNRVGFNTGSGIAIASSAIVEIVSTTGGFLPPRMTTTQRTSISSPAEGLTVYDLTLHKLYVYDGTTWQAAW